MAVSSQLFLQTKRLLPGEEWSPLEKGWTFVQVGSGEAYVLGPNLAIACPAGSLFVSAGGVPAQLRSSQIGPSVMHWFRLEAEAMFGVLTLPERRRLDQSEAVTPKLPWVLSPETEAARQFARGVQAPATTSLGQRSRWLEVVALALLPAVSIHQKKHETHLDAGDRLEELVACLTDSELLALSSGQLAEICHCEKRRLLQLFRERIGVSLPVQQSFWRKSKACALLGQQGATVATVALACGYADPDAFSAWFRRQTGMSPLPWKRENSK